MSEPVRDAAAADRCPICDVGARVAIDNHPGAGGAIYSCGYRSQRTPLSCGRAGLQVPFNDLGAETDSEVADGDARDEAADAVNHPPHYTMGGVEVIDAIEAWDLGFHLGNVVKYVARAGRKGDRLECLRKAQWYLQREIERLERGAP